MPLLATCCTTGVGGESNIDYSIACFFAGSGGPRKSMTAARLAPSVPMGVASKGWLPPPHTDSEQPKSGEKEEKLGMSSQLQLPDSFAESRLE